MKWLFFGLAGLLWIMAGTAGAASREASRTNGRTRSRAVGSPGDGHLEHGVRLSADDSLYFKYGSGPDERFGTEELVGALQRAATRMQRTNPGTALTVGDLSRRAGGRMRPHLSHRNGRDVDLGYYLLRHDEPTHANRFVRMSDDGTGHGYAFDDARTWELVQTLLTDPGVEIEAILIAQPLERRLLRRAQRSHAPRYIYERARLVMYQPRRGGRHDDHMHVRIRCPSDDRPECVDTQPMLPIMPPLAMLAR